jgi:hypothetical protein
MSNAKEKAEELHVGFWKLTNDSRIAKQCALIAVDEILKVFNSPIPNYNYYQEVKEEIGKL